MDFIALQDDQSDSRPADDDNEYKIVGLLRRGRVGAARVRPHKHIYWELDFAFPAGMRVKRFRKYYKSPTRAYRAAIRITKQLKRHGELAVEMNSGQRFIAMECFRLLEPIYGEDPGALLQLVRDHRKIHPLGGNARTMDDVRKEVVAAKEKGNRRERYVKGLDYKLTCLIRAVGNKPIIAVTTNDLEDELARHPKWSPSSVIGATSAWKVMFNYAIKRGYIITNPCNKIDLPQKEYPEPKIFTVDQVQRMLALTLWHDGDPLLPACRAYLAIGLFAGIRPEEMQRLRWEQIDFATGSITITGANAKCRARRIVDMSASLVSWLKPVARKRGPVLRHPLARLRQAMRLAMSKYPKEVWPFQDWPHDGLRHSFGSYHFAFHRNEALVKNQMGHSDDGRMFFHHYRVLVHQSVAQRFWRITAPVAFLTA